MEIALVCILKGDTSLSEMKSGWRKYKRKMGDGKIEQCTNMQHQIQQRIPFPTYLNNQKRISIKMQNNETMLFEPIKILYNPHRTAFYSCSNEETGGIEFYFAKFTLHDTKAEIRVQSYKYKA